MRTSGARAAVVASLAAAAALAAGCTGGTPAPAPELAPSSVEAPSLPTPPPGPPAALTDAGPAPSPAAPGSPASGPPPAEQPPPSVPAVPPAGTAQPPAQPPAEPAQPPSRDTLVVLATEGVPSLDPEAFGTAAQQEVLANVLEPLVRIAPARAAGRPGQRIGVAPRVVPALCRAVQVLEAGVRCRLGDARSSAGNEITSADVDWTLRYALAANGPGRLVLGLAGVDLARPLTVEGEKTFTINAASPTSALAPALALLAFSPLDSVEATAHATEADPFAREWLASHPVGFGPYRVDEFDPGRQVTLSVNPGYRGTAAYPRPSISRVVHRAVPDPGTRAGLLDSGQAQLVRAAEPDLVRALARSTAVTVERLPYNAQIALFLDTTSPPFDDPAVRRAIACAVDKGAFVRAVSYGQYRVANGITSPEKLPAQAEEGAEPCPRRDLERARRLLARAGGWRRTVPLVYAEPDSGPNAAAGARVLAADLAEAGITVEPTEAPEPERLFADALRGELPLVLLVWGANVPDAGYALSAWFGGASQLNVSRFASPAADAALAEALRLPLDDPARNDLLRTFQRRIVSSAAVVPLAALANQVVVHRSLCGVRPDPVDVVRWQLLSYCRAAAQPARPGEDRR